MTNLRNPDDALRALSAHMGRGQPAPQNQNQSVSDVTSRILGSLIEQSGKSITAGIPPAHAIQTIMQNPVIADFLKMATDPTGLGAKTGHDLAMKKIQERESEIIQKQVEKYIKKNVDQKLAEGVPPEEILMLTSGNLPEDSDEIQLGFKGGHFDRGPGQRQVPVEQSAEQPGMEQPGSDKIGEQSAGVLRQLMSGLGSAATRFMEGASGVGDLKNELAHKLAFEEGKLKLQQKYGEAPAGLSPEQAIKFSALSAGRNSVDRASQILLGETNDPRGLLFDTITPNWMTSEQGQQFNQAIDQALQALNSTIGRDDPKGEKFKRMEKLYRPKVGDKVSTMRERLKGLREFFEHGIQVSDPTGIHQSRGSQMAQRAEMLNALMQEREGLGA
jgi:hypothetical protein